MDRLHPAKFVIYCRILVRAKHIFHTTITVHRTNRVECLFMEAAVVTIIVSKREANAKADVTRNQRRFAKKMRLSTKDTKKRFVENRSTPEVAQRHTRDGFMTHRIRCVCLSFTGAAAEIRTISRIVRLARRSVRRSDQWNRRVNASTVRVSRTVHSSLKFNTVTTNITPNSVVGHV